MAEVVGGVLGAAVGGFVGLLVGNPIAGAAAGYAIVSSAISGINEGDNAKKTANMNADLLDAQTEKQATDFHDQGEGIKGKQAAAVGASGVVMEGSPLLVMQETARQLKEDEDWIRKYGADASAIVRKGGEDAYTASLLQAGSTMLSRSAQLYDAFSGFYGQGSKPIGYGAGKGSTGGASAGRR